MIQRAKLGMALFLISEAVLFVFLMVAYVYFRYPNRSLDPALAVGAGTVFTACLLASCFTVWRASTSSSRNNAKTARVWLGATILLGIAFLAAQGDEYKRLFSRGTSGAALVTLTGCHELHVAVGILLLGGAFLFQSGELRSVAVQTVALYWYFVVAVWLAIFSILYLRNFL